MTILSSIMWYSFCSAQRRFTTYNTWPYQWRSKSIPGPYDIGSNSLNLLIFSDINTVTWLFTSCFNYVIYAWKVYLMFSRPFIACKPPNNCNKLWVFFFIIITQSLIFLYIWRSNTNNKCVLRSFVCSEVTTFTSVQAACESIIFSS